MDILKEEDTQYYTWYGIYDKFREKLLQVSAYESSKEEIYTNMLDTVIDDTMQTLENGMDINARSSRRGFTDGEVVPIPMSYVEKVLVVVAGITGKNYLLKSI